MEEEKINQRYGAYYPPELDENLKVKTEKTAADFQKTQNFDEFSAQKQQKNTTFPNFEQLSKILGSQESSETLSKILSLKNKNLPEVLSAFSNSQEKKTTARPQKPRIEEF